MRKKFKSLMIISIMLICSIVFGDMTSIIYASTSSNRGNNTLRYNPNFAVDTSIIEGENEKVDAKIAIIHFNPLINEKERNIKALTKLVDEAFSQGANIVVAPELSTTGYLINKDNVLNGLGIVDVETELKEIMDLAKKYNGYVCMGYAELTEDNHTYNSAILFGPEGVELNQRKRTLPGWNERGDLELTTVETPYGNVGMIICADSYSPDYTRLLALNGADIVLLPCTWWGDEGQLSTWKTRARENGIWMVIGNRWGSEYDSYYGYDVDMNDAPSAIISPQGEAELVYMKKEDMDNEDKILLQDIVVEKERDVYSLAYRSPSSYTAIGNEYYVPSTGNIPFPNLPQTGEYETVALNYIPEKAEHKNIAKIENLLDSNSVNEDIVTLPTYGFTDKAINISKADWSEEKSIQTLQELVDERDIELLATEVCIKEKNNKSDAMLIIQKNEMPIVTKQIHDEVKDKMVIEGSHKEPFYVDLEGARVGIITGQDYMFPETITALAKQGTDIVLVSSDIIDEEKSNSSFYYVNKEFVECSLETIISHCIHISFADSSGFAEVIESEWGVKKNLDRIYEEGAAYLKVDSSLTKYKYLQEYLPVDVETLTYSEKGEYNKAA